MSGWATSPSGACHVLVRAVLLALCSACTLFDPIAEVPRGHREFADAKAAIGAILAENGRPRIYAVGEYHQTKAVSAPSSLARFTTEIVGLLEPYAGHLVVESWLEAPCGSRADGKQTGAQIATGTGRSTTTSMEVMRLVRRAETSHVQSHTLPISCLELDSVADASGHVNFLLLLELVTEKLASVTRSLVTTKRAVIVYGGALHNDLYPRWPLEALSYARSLADELGGGVLEIDLVVPEIVAPLAMIRNEPWFPLLGRAHPDRVLVWERGPASYVVILPAQSEEVARVAKLVDRM
jgi:hypothetical protein